MAVFVAALMYMAYSLSYFPRLEKSYISLQNPCRAESTITPLLFGKASVFSYIDMECVLLRSSPPK